ncbi:M1 family metallopeptidase [Formosa sp. A9]|uniref:M1 family metallopeptidase n=1 Tax=Formosa sp. A9 TaxID=3442641 RepID=UPI003EB89B47
MRHLKFLVTIAIAVCSQNLLAQQLDVVDFKSIEADLEIDPYRNKVSGAVNYVFDILKPSDSIFIDAQNMQIAKVRFNGDSVQYYTTNTKLWLIGKFQKSQANSIQLHYQTAPKKAMYFIGWNNGGKPQVWTQGQGKYTSNWLPSFDDMNEKTTLDLQVKFPKDFTVIANGELKTQTATDSLVVWKYQFNKPISNYLFALAAGNYNKTTEYSKTGVPIELYYYPEDSLKVAPTYRYSKQMFDFLEAEIGEPYPWQNYKQIPVSDFLYAGMENASATIFSDAYMVDDIGFFDRNYVNVNAHELAHQWFGDLVTEVSGTDHWLQEGFATYYALLAERDIFGLDYYKMRLYQYAKELEAQDKNGGSTALLNPKSSSTTFYKKGAWTLHALRSEIGDVAFKSAVKNYLIAHQYQNVNTSDFIKAAEQASGKNLDAFFEIWLQSETFPTDFVLNNTKDDMSYYLKYIDNLSCVADNNKAFLLDPSKYYFEKQQIISAHPELITEAVIKQNGTEVRQTIASVLTEIPSALRPAYETLLDDPSYQTQEMALYNLWSNFPISRSYYLNKTKNSIGFNSKNIRQLWLALALSTPEYAPNNNYTYINELIGYTSPVYSFEVRELAFNYVNLLKLFNETAITNLIEATKHHNWRFSKMAKAMLQMLQQDPTYQELINQVQETHTK